MKHFTMGYINENGTDSGILEFENDYYTVVWLEADQVWVFGTVCNVGLLADGYYCAEYIGKDQALQELAEDLGYLDRGDNCSGEIVIYSREAV